MPTPVEKLSRPQVIERIRGALLTSAQPDECACAVAARRGVFCRGFSALSDAQFRKRFDWIAAKRPKASRAELEDLVSRYHLARQEVRGSALCCDVETREHCGCDGWNTFDNGSLERAYKDLTGRDAVIG